MRISTSNRESNEPSLLKEGLKRLIQNSDGGKSKGYFHSEFRIIARDKYGDDVVYEIVETFGEAFAEFESQKTDVDEGRFASTEIEVVLKWEEDGETVEEEESEIYFYGHRNNQFGRE